MSLELDTSSRFSSSTWRVLRHARLFVFVLLACLLSMSRGQGLQGQKRSWDLVASEILVLSATPPQFWESQETRLPSPFQKGMKEEPEVDLRIAEGVGKAGRAGPTARGPGCGHSGVATTPSPQKIHGVKPEYRRGIKRYLSGDYDGAVESLSRLLETEAESELRGYCYYYLGASYYHLGRIHDALSSLEQVVRGHPDHPLSDWARYSMGCIHMGEGDFSEALSHFQEVVKGQGGNAVVAIALFWEGEFLGRLGRTDQAIASKRNFLKRYPNHSRGPDVLLSLGGYLSRLQRFREAAEAFRGFVAAYPSHRYMEQALYGLGQSLIHEGKYDEGIATLKTVLKDYPSTALANSIRFGLVLAYLGKNEETTALQIYGELTARSPDFEGADHALFQIANSFLNKGEYARSVKVYQNLLRINPKTDLKPLVYFNMGEALYELTEYRQAIDSYALAQATAQEGSIIEEALFKMGLCAYQQNEYDRAIESWMRLSRDFPNSIRQQEATYWMGEALLQNGNPKGAAALFWDLDDTGDICARALNSLGRCYFRLGEWGMAVQSFLELLDRYPHHPLAVDAYLGLGEAFYHRKDYSRALFYLEELAEREDARSLDRVYFVQGRIYYEQGEFDLAIDRLSFVLKAFAESPLARESQYWVAWSYYRTGMYERAIEAFAEVTEHPLSSNHAAEAVLKTGDCYRYLDSYEAALKAYTQVIREFPHSRVVPEAEHGILLAFERQGDYESFGKRANAFLTRYPTHPLGADILMRIAQRYLDEDRVDKAILTYRALVWRYPRNELADDAQFRLGEMYRDQQDFGNAVSEFGLVVKQYPRSDYVIDAYYEIAQSYFALGDYRRALEGYERVARGFPESHRAEEATVGAIDCLKRLDRIDLAEARLLELMERGVEIPLQSQAALRLGLILFRAMRYGEAIEVLRRVTRLANAEEASLAQIKIGEIYREMGDSRTAIIELMKAVSLYPGQTDRVDAALFEVGEIYMEQRRWAKAKRIYSRVIEISSSESARKKAQEILAEIESEYVSQ